MSSSMPTNPSVLSTFHQNWKWFLWWGIGLFLLGVATISIATLTTLALMVFLGLFLLAIGIIIFADAFKCWWPNWKKFIPQAFIGIVYFLLGALFLFEPLQGALSLTLVLSIAFMVIGLFRLLTALFIRMPNWGWFFLSGLITFTLGYLILTGWPSTGLYIIGLFIGIELMFVGLTYIMVALQAKKTA